MASLVVELPSQSHFIRSGELVFFCKFLPRLVEREQSPSIISKLHAKYPKGQLQSPIWSLCTKDWSSLYARLQINIFLSKSNTESNYKPKNNKESPGRRAESEERRERFVTVVSENKRFLFTPPNGCEHFLNTAQSVCIRKVKGTAPISTPKSYLIYKVSRQVQYDSLIGVDWHNLRKLQASLQGMGSWRATIFSSTVAYCLPNPRV